MHNGSYSAQEIERFRLQEISLKVCYVLTFNSENFKHTTVKAIRSVVLRLHFKLAIFLHLYVCLHMHRRFPFSSSPKRFRNKFLH
jgi:hypothetical protein